MTAFEYPPWAALMAPSPGAEGGAQDAGAAGACPLDVVHTVRTVQFVDVANVVPPAPAFVRQLVVRLLSLPALTAAH
jgi:hypothetical protein